MGRWVCSLALVAALTAGIAVVPSPPAAASDDAGEVARIIARRLADGRVEFGLRHADGSEQLPTPRLFPYRSAVEGRWYRSGPVSVGSADDVRIIARKLADGRIEFALSFGGSIWYPDARYFPYRTARVGRWLRSSEFNELVASARATTPTNRSSTTSEPAASRQNPPAAGTCARGGEGVTLYCTRQTGRAANRQELRVHLDAFVAMLRPHWPWIGVALESTGGWSFGSCGHPQAAGCYFPGENRIVLAASNLAGQPLWAIEETLIHELAHAYDWAMTPDDQPEHQPSVRSMTAYPVEFRHELFADTLAANVLGNRSSPVYFQESRRAFGLAYESWRDAGFTNLDRRSFDAAVDRIPANPTAQDRRAVWQAVCGNCGTPVPAVVWTNISGAPEPDQGRRGTGLLIDFPQPPKIVVTIILPCFAPMEINAAIGNARSSVRWARLAARGLDFGRNVDSEAISYLRAAANQLEAAANQLEAAADRICAETPRYAHNEPNPFDGADHLYAEAERLCASAERLIADVRERWSRLAGNLDAC